MVQQSENNTSGHDVSEISDLDSLLKPLGGFGKFQIFNMMCICAIIIICSFSELGYVLTTAKLKHRCLIAECEDANASYSAVSNPWLSSAIPAVSSGQLDSCHRYNYTESQNQQCSNSSFSAVQYECNSFIWETEEWTVAREDWAPRCDDDDYLLSLIGSLNNVGQVVGGLYVGYLQDRYGRKLVIVTLTIFVVIVGTIKTFSVNYGMMMALELIEATGSVALFNGPFILALEIVDPSKRVLAGAVASLAYPAGEMILGLVQYLTLDWRNTIRICYVPFLLAISFYWILPESVRWLLDNGRTDDATAVLRNIARVNRTVLPEQAVKNIIAIETEKSKQAQAEKKQLKNSVRFRQLWQSNLMRWRTVCTFIVWLCTIFVYFAMSVNSVGISDDKFINFILTALVEIPGYIAVYFALDRLGRKITQTSLLSLCAVACLFDAFVPQDDGWAWARLTLFLVGKFGVAGALFAVDVYTTELFPTFVRSTIMSISLLFGKVATVLAPEVNLLKEFYEPLPLLIFGGAALIGALATMTFPETLNTVLPNTVQEAENLGKNKNKSNFPSLAI